MLSYPNQKLIFKKVAGIFNSNKIAKFSVLTKLQMFKDVQHILSSLDISTYVSRNESIIKQRLIINIMNKVNHVVVKTLFWKIIPRH